jgi:hypothetical protein
MASPRFMNGSVAGNQAPPRLLPLGIGAAGFLINHLHVVLAGGINSEALVLAALATLLGAGLLLIPRGLDALDWWSRRSFGRLLILLGAFMGLTVGLAELVARVGYGESIFP